MHGLVAAGSSLLPGRTVFDVTHPRDAREEREEYARLVAGEVDFRPGGLACVLARPAAALAA